MAGPCPALGYKKLKYRCTVTSGIKNIQKEMQFVFVKFKKSIVLLCNLLGIYNSVCLPRFQTIGTVWNNDLRPFVSEAKSTFYFEIDYGVHFLLFTMTLAVRRPW